MHKQRGLSLGSLLVAIVVIIVLALLAMRVIPAYTEYFKIVKCIKSTAIEVSEGGKQPTVDDVRKIYTRRAGIDDISALKAEDLDITKQGDRVVISFEYQKKAPLVSNVSLLFEFKGSSQR